jgi:hypothetical protein
MTNKSERFGMMAFGVGAGLAKEMSRSFDVGYVTASQ